MSVKIYIDASETRLIFQENETEMVFPYRYTLKENKCVIYSLDNSSTSLNFSLDEALDGDNEPWDPEALRPLLRQYSGFRTASGGSGADANFFTIDSMSTGDRTHNLAGYFVRLQNASDFRIESAVAGYEMGFKDIGDGHPEFCIESPTDGTGNLRIRRNGSTIYRVASVSGQAWTWSTRLRFGDQATNNMHAIKDVSGQWVFANDSSGLVDTESGVRLKVFGTGKFVSKDASPSSDALVVRDLLDMNDHFAIRGNGRADFYGDLFARSGNFYTETIYRTANSSTRISLLSGIHHYSLGETGSPYTHHHFDTHDEVEDGVLLQISNNGVARYTMSAAGTENKPLTQIFADDAAALLGGLVEWDEYVTPAGAKRMILPA